MAGGIAPPPGLMKNKHTWISLLLLLISVMQVHATAFYLTQAGAGTKNGSSWADAYAVTSLWTVVNTTMQPGDTLYLGGPQVSGGTTYGDTRLTITPSGT